MYVWPPHLAFPEAAPEEARLSGILPAEETNRVSFNMGWVRPRLEALGAPAGDAM
jgi:hypothetical protein